MSTSDHPSMMTKPRQRLCPKCLDLRPAHCSSPTCDLVLCGPCDGYGKPDGSLWRRNEDNTPT